jgi:ABC-type transporter Mla subunit MlaD
MASHKRKQAEVFTENAGPAVVVVGDNSDPISSLKFKLQAIADTLNQQDDPILSAIENPAPDSEETDILEQARGIQSQLHDQIDQAKDACQHESDVLSNLSSRLDSMKKKRESLICEMEDLDSMQLNLQRRIALHQEEASQEIESIDQVEEERKRQVPRLKTQISLYAATTLIKWDFSSQDALSGQVVRNMQLKLASGVLEEDPKVFIYNVLMIYLCIYLSLSLSIQAIPMQHGLKTFSIDPRDHSPFEVANKLWSLMEGMTL